MTEITHSNWSGIELAEVDSGLQQSIDGEVDTSTASSNPGERPDQQLKTDRSKIDSVELESTIPLDATLSDLDISPIAAPSTRGWESSGGSTGGEGFDESFGFVRADSRSENLGNPPSPDYSFEGETHAQNRRLTFVKSVGVTGLSGSCHGTRSPPLRSNVYRASIPRSIVHSLRPVPEINNVRINRAYELRYTENQEINCLRNARTVGYRLYISTAKVLNRIPKIELGAGIP